MATGGENAINGADNSGAVELRLAGYDLVIVKIHPKGQKNGFHQVNIIGK